MNMKLHAEKQAQTSGIRVGIIASRMILPAALPARASPPGERSQISSRIIGLDRVLKLRGHVLSICPSALSTRTPFTVSSVNFISRVGRPVEILGAARIARVGGLGRGNVQRAAGRRRRLILMRPEPRQTLA